MIGRIHALNALFVLAFGAVAAAQSNTVPVKGTIHKPAEFVRQYAEMHEVSCNPEMNWAFRTNGTFKAISSTSTYGFSITGKWEVVSNAYIHVTGVSTNTRSGIVRQQNNTIRSIRVWNCFLGSPPNVVLEKAEKIEAFERQPTKP